MNPEGLNLTLAGLKIDCSLCHCTATLETQFYLLCLKDFLTDSKRVLYESTGCTTYQNIFPLANTFAERENVRLGQSPTGTQMRSISTFFIHVWVCH